MTEDKINPDHYKGATMQAIDVIDDFNLGFNLGNVVKYILRAEHKRTSTECLEKARWYLDHEIEKLKKGVG